MKFYQSLQFKFTVVICFVMLFSTVLLSTISTRFATSTVSKTTYNLMNAITDSAAGKVKGEVEKNFLVLNTIAESDFLKSPNIPLLEKCQQLSRIAKVEPSYENIGYYNLKGESYTAAGQYIKLDRDYIKQAALGKSCVMDQSINPITNLLFQIYSVPVYDFNNNPIGCLSLNVHGNTLTNRIENIKFGSEGSTIQVVNRVSGYTIASTTFEEVLNRQNVKQSIEIEEGIVPVLQAMINGDTGSQLFKDTRAHGETLVAAYRPVPNSDWSVLCVANYNDFYSGISKMKLVSQIILIAVIIFAGTLMLLISRRTFKPLKNVKDAIQNIASGDADLTQRLKVYKNDEVGEIVTSFNSFTGNLHTIISQIKDSKDQLGVAGSDLKASTEDTSSSITQILANIDSVHNQITNQSNSVHQTASAVNEIASNIESLEHMIENQSSGVTEASAAVEEMIGNIQSVNTSMEKMSSSFEELTKSAQEGANVQSEVNSRIEQISVLSNTLQEANIAIAAIAEQTNLLAMNAAIEAAHAGDAGKGFAVVADEIRKLSETSTQQSNTIGEQLTNIQTSIQEVVTASEQSSQSFNTVSTKIKETDDIVRQIKAAMTEQNEGSKQIITALNSMNNSTMQVRNAGQEMAEGNKAILEEVKALQDATGVMLDSMNEMQIGATKINETGAALRQISNQVDESITGIGKEIDQFKV